MAAAVWVLLDLSVWTVVITAALSGLLDTSFWKVAIVCAVIDWFLFSSVTPPPSSSYTPPFNPTFHDRPWTENDPLLPSVSSTRPLPDQYGGTYWPKSNSGPLHYSYSAVSNPTFHGRPWSDSDPLLSSTRPPRDHLGTYWPHRNSGILTATPPSYSAAVSNPILRDQSSSSNSPLSWATLSERTAPEIGSVPRRPPTAVIPPAPTLHGQPWSGDGLTLFIQSSGSELRLEIPSSYPASGEPLLVDLHGLSVREAKLVVKTTIFEVERLDHRSALNSSPLEVYFIVGKGRHSDNGIAKLKPALTTYISRELSRNVVTDPTNNGRIIVSCGLNAADSAVPHWRQRKLRFSRLKNESQARPWSRDIAHMV
ncbi:hypothetical protein B0H14DRAFT_2677232 [Mycena olivaceomarginata]|nr:hypothetical protein B0H14DRAFT_2677232 [Mycena olivaceomarginata]